MIYLDYAANTPAQKNVLECFCRIENEYIGNPNSVHPAGIRAKERMEEATQMIARLLDAKPDEVIYTSVKQYRYQGNCTVIAPYRTSYYFNTA